MAYSFSRPSSSSGLHYLNSPFGDTTLTKVFVGGLAWETESETLRRHFEQYGDILEAVVISDRNTGRSKGYGFVTFQDPESAKRACADPSPIIDGRRANCNLASLGRPRPPATPFAQLRPPGPYFGNIPVPRGPYIQQNIPFGYQQGIPYAAPYGYAPYGSEYMYPQNPYNPYTMQQYLQFYGVPGAENAAIYPYGPQSVPAGHNYAPALQGYSVPGQHHVRLGGPSVSGIGSPRPTTQAMYTSGAEFRPPRFIVPSQFSSGSGSEPTT